MSDFQDSFVDAEIVPAPVPAPAPVPVTEMTNVQLAELISTERVLLDQEKTEYEALEASIQDGGAAFELKLATAIEEENTETASLIALNQSFDEAALANRAEQLAMAESELDVKLQDYQSLVQANNELASSVFSKFTTNLKKLQDVKSQINSLKGKLDRFSQIIDTCSGKK
jgi:hypothetical protein